MDNKIVGLIAGNGQLPSLIIEHCNRNSISIFVVLLSEEAHISEQVLKNNKFLTLKVGQIGQMISFFKENGVTDIMLAGGIKRPNLLTVKVDAAGAKLLALLLKNKILGDDKLLRIVSNYFEEQGFKVIDPNSLSNLNLCIKEGLIVLPSKNTAINMHDIELGLKVVRQIGELDIGQSVIVENGLVLAIEAVEGTDELILRSKNLQKASNKAILIKSKKPNQDSRFDSPAIGPQTIENAAAAGLVGIAIEANGVFIINYNKVIEKAKELGIFLISVK